VGEIDMSRVNLEIEHKNMLPRWTQPT